MVTIIFSPTVCIYNINIKVNSDDSSSEDNLEIKQIHLKKKRYIVLFCYDLTNYKLIY